MNIILKIINQNNYVISDIPKNSSCKRTKSTICNFSDFVTQFKPIKIKNLELKENHKLRVSDY